MAVFKRWNGANWEIIGPTISDSRINTVEELIAPEYDPNSPYSVGDFVVHSDTLYKCNTAIDNDGELWNSSHWTETKIGDAVSELKSALNDVNGNQKNYSQVYTDWKLLRNADTQNITDDNVEFTITSGKNFAFRDTYQLGHTPYKNGDVIYIGIHDINVSSTATNQRVLFRVFFYLNGIENINERKTFDIYDGTSFFKESMTIPQNVNSMTIGFEGSQLTSLSIGKFIISNRDFESFTLFTRGNSTGIDGIYKDISDIKNELSIKTFDIDSYLYKKYIPSYYYETSDPSSFSGINYLEEQISTIPNGKHTIFITDMHWDKNQKHSLDLLQYVRGRIGGVPVIFGGDAITAETDKYQAAWLTSQFYSQFVAALGKSFLPVVGNHDTNMAAATASEVSTKYLPFTQIKKLGFDSISDRAVRHIVSDADLQPYSNDQTIRAELIDYFKLTYYIDDDINKIRYIFVNTGNPARGTVYDVFGVSGRTEVMLSIPFIYSAMLTTPSGYDLILTGHMIVGNTVYQGEDYFDNNSSPIKNLLNMLGALKAKDSVSYDQTSISQTTRGWVATGTATYNFANANDIGRVIVLCGHYHIDTVYVHTYGANPSTAAETEWTSGNINQSEQYKIPIILTTTDASGASAYPSIPVSRRVEMENDTILEQAFDVITLTDNGVTTTRIGAGNSRQIPII